MSAKPFWPPDVLNASPGTPDRHATSFSGFPDFPTQARYAQPAPCETASIRFDASAVFSWLRLRDLFQTIPPYDPMADPPPPAGAYSGEASIAPLMVPKTFLSLSFRKLVKSPVYGGQVPRAGLDRACFFRAPPGKHLAGSSVVVAGQGPTFTQVQGPNFGLLGLRGLLPTTLDFCFPNSSPSGAHLRSPATFLRLIVHPNCNLCEAAPPFLVPGGKGY